MKKPKFSVTRANDSLAKLVKQADKRILAIWAIDCVEHVLHYFEEVFPGDHRPREAIETLRSWVDTGVISMVEIRKAALASHAAAREVGEDNAARSVARAAGQAVAIAHVPDHSIAATKYAQQAVYRARNSQAAAKESKWQNRRLLELTESSRKKRGSENLT